MTPSTQSAIRINKFIAEHSQHSRRKADQLIMEGKVQVNGHTINTPGLRINPQTDTVQVLKKTITTNTKKHYLLLNKPKNYICTRSDELGRKTVLELLPPIPNLKPVGRLDKDSQGLLLISNDGEFIHQYTHPKHNCEKEYFVKIKGKLLPHEQQKLEQGVIIDRKKTSPAKITISKKSPQETQLNIIIKEGRNRQIRKMFDQFNHPVKHLQRIRIGKIMLHDLPIGQYRLLNKTELNGL